MLYVAYGSNLNHGQMLNRCPAAKFVAGSVLFDHQLVFTGREGNHGHANIVPNKNSSVPVGVWEITPACEKALDFYEGFPSYYRKEFVMVGVPGGKVARAMAYVMNSEIVRAPASFYYKAIADGYNSCGLNDEPLRTALLMAVAKDKSGGFSYEC